MLQCVFVQTCSCDTTVSPLTPRPATYRCFPHTFIPTTSTSLERRSSSSAVQVPLPFTMWCGLIPTRQCSMQAVAVLPGIFSEIVDHLGPTRYMTAVAAAAKGGGKGLAINSKYKNIIGTLKFGETKTWLICFRVLSACCTEGIYRKVETKRIRKVTTKKALVERRT